MAKTQSTAGLVASEDPALSHVYLVELEGILVGEFLSCSGLQIEREPKTYEEGGVNDFVHQLPGRIKYTNIVLKRGITYGAELWNWFQQGLLDGKVKRVAMSIILGNSEGLKVKHWDVIGAYPVKYVGPELKSDSNEAAVETIEIAHQGLRLNPETRKSMKKV